MSDESYGLIVSFPDGSNSFVHGFEAGMIWGRLENGESEFLATIHTENSDVVSRMAEASCVYVRISPTEVDGWSIAEFIGSHKLKPKLTLVRGGIVQEPPRG